MAMTETVRTLPHGGSCLGKARSREEGFCPACVCLLLSKGDCASRHRVDGLEVLRFCFPAAEAVVSLDRRAVDDAIVRGIAAAGLVQDAPVVPEDHVGGPPLVVVGHDHPLHLVPNLGAQG